MTSGKIIGIFLHGAKGEELAAVPEVKAIPGCGLEGDRLFRPEPGRLQADQEITLIESEAIEAVGRDAGIKLRPSQTRRQLLTRGVQLNELAGHEFQIGAVRLRGHRFCQPCDHLESLTQPGVKAAYHDRGGLRAQVLTEGVIRVGDAISV